jgi:hypothetical protein
MDYFQGVVTEYLVADRSTYVNTELLIQLDEDEPTKGRHWYCDAAAVDFRDQKLFLCEVTYSKSMTALAKRLLAWDAHWQELRVALARDCHIPDSWTVQPWAFIPEDYCTALKSKISLLAEAERGDKVMPYPRITFLESVVPWNYVTWDRKVTALEDEE